MQLRCPGFAISKYKVSNGEYLEFVREGGPAPNFWEREDGGGFIGACSDACLCRSTMPVWVTWEQASAYAAWRGLSLPTEAQFQRARRLTAAGPRAR